MVTPYYTDEHVTLYHGDAADVLAKLAPESVDCIVTSPPYFGLRDYGVEGQLGAESSPAEYVENMRALFAEARRVLADDGTLWLNLGDSYYSGKGSPTQPDLSNKARRPPARVLDQPGANWAKPKNLLGIPWRVAFALQDDGWVLRNDIIWAKPNAMPESVTDRLSNRHEHLFMLSKSRRYWFDLDPVREEHEFAIPGRKGPGGGWADGQSRGTPASGRRTLNGNIGGKNPGDVWSIATTPFPGAHFAVFPAALAERCILAGCKPGGVVLDPFSGSGTTGMVATKHGRRYVGIDLNDDYLRLSLETRLSQGVLDLGVGA